MQSPFTATSTAQERCFSLVMGVFAVILFTVFFPLFIVVALALAAGVALYRGSYFIRWRAPGECMDLQSWAAFEWDYQGLGGRQSGVRALGLEVAYNGLLR